MPVPAGLLLGRVLARAVTGVTGVVVSDLRARVRGSRGWSGRGPMAAVRAVTAVTAVAAVHEDHQQRQRYQ
jgi:hypothetical protein